MNDLDLDFLKRFKCTTAFYNYIYQCKVQLAFHSKVEQIHVETSVKYKNDTVHTGRYTLPILLDEFLEYTLDQQETIFKAVGFKREDFRDKLRNVRKGSSSDIIFGFDGPIGKLYFDHLDEPTDSHIVCYESTGKRKYYRFQKGSTTRLDVTDDTGKKIGIHIRINGENNIYWYAIGPDSITIYYRPPISTIN